MKYIIYNSYYKGYVRVVNSGWNSHTETSKDIKNATRFSSIMDILKSASTRHTEFPLAFSNAEGEDSYEILVLEDE